MALVGVINLPIIHYSVEWWNTLHQGATISKFAKPSIAAEMLWPLLLSILGLALIIATVTLMRMQNEILRREMNRPWVVSMVNKLLADKTQGGTDAV
jgi:heme exporter protein C